MIQIVIMASGYSRRMGTDKLCADLMGKPVIQWVIDAAVGTGVKSIYVVYRESPVADIARCSGITALYNPWSFLGQSATVRVAAESLLPGKPILFIPGDQPLITQESLLRMMAGYRESRPDIVCASWNGKRTMPTLFSGSMTQQLMMLEGDKGGSPLIESGRYRIAYQELSFEEEKWDIDTLEDMKRVAMWCEGIGETGRKDGKKAPGKTKKTSFQKD